MKTKKIIGLLLAGSMLLSSFTAFASSLDKTGTTAEYGFGDTVTITTDGYQAVKIVNAKDSSNVLVRGVSEKQANGDWTYELELPTASDDEDMLLNVGAWKVDNTYDIYLNNEKMSQSFKIVDTGNDPENVGGKEGTVKINVKKGANSVTPKTWTKTFISDFDSKFAASDKITVHVVVAKNKNGKTLYTNGTDYDIRFKSTASRDDDFTATVSELENSYIELWYKSAGTYYVNLGLECGGETVWYDSDNTQGTGLKVSVSSSNSGSSGGGGGGSSTGGSTWIPGITAANTPSGINVQLNPSQETVADTKNVIGYTASFVTPDSFKVGVTVNGVAVTNFQGYDPVYVKVPYAANLTDTTTLVCKDAAGNIIPRSYYSNGYMYVNLKNIGSTYTIFNNPVSFDDVTHDWAVKQINGLAAREIINGVGDNLYDPDRNVTRAEFIKMIMAMFDMYDPSAVATFADIDNSQWYAPYIATAQSLGITNGYPEDNTFRPNQIISREEMSTMLFRAAEKLSVEIEAKISKVEFNDDAAIQDYAKVCVYKMQQAQVLQGVGNNTFDPQGSCTRAQAAVAIWNMFVLSMTK